MEDIVKQTIYDFKKYLFRDGLEYSEIKDKNDIVSFNVSLNGLTRPYVGVTFTPYNKIDSVYRAGNIDGGDFGFFVKHSDALYEVFPDANKYEVIFEYYGGGDGLGYNVTYFHDGLEDIIYHEWLDEIESRLGEEYYEEFFQDN